MGSSESGDDIEAGRTNMAEHPTVIQGGRPSESEVDFLGTRVFEAGPRRDGQRPTTTLSGILGKGWNGADSPVGRQPGTGVMGLGAPNRGPGMVGFGAGARTGVDFLSDPQINIEGLGGTGMIGIGGNGATAPFGVADDIAVDLPSLPGAGVVGRGGHSIYSAPGPGNGPGVVGIAGGEHYGRPAANLSQENLAATANVGVVGFGGNGPHGGGGSWLGPPSAGAGVRGIGGVATTTEDHIPSRIESGGPGVVGIAGKVSVPADATLSNVGVAGWAGVGPGVLGYSENSHAIRGISNKSPAVFGSSGDSNGGYFESERVAQIHLQPLRDEIPDPNGIIPGFPGDILVTKSRSTKDRSVWVAGLWFCKMQGTNNWVTIA